MDNLLQSTTALGFFATSVGLAHLHRQQKLHKISKITQTLASEKVYDCIVIGAGASGLRAARNLHHEHKIPLDKILVLEAQDYIGGRIRQGLEFIPNVKIELGAEILHGNNTLLTDFAKETNEPIEEIYCWAHGDGGPLEHPVNGGYGLYYFGKGNQGGKREKGKLLRFDDTSDESFVKLNETLWSLSEHYHEDLINENISMDQFLTLLNFNSDMKGMVNAGFSNTLCTNSNDLSLKQSIRWTRLWNIESDEGEFKFKNSYASLINYLKKDLTILTNTPVTKVERVIVSEDNSALNHVILTTKDGEKYYTKTTVISASPDVIKRNLIEFTPSLPSKKQLAFQSTYMHTAMKVFVKFSKVCWPKGLTGMIMTDPDFLFPEIWFRDVTDIVDPSSNQGVCYATGFATSGFADKILTLSKEEVYRRFVEQLDVIFSELTPNHWLNKPVLSLPKPSEVFLGGTMQVWSPTNHPYIGGGYCSPRAGYPVTSGAMIAEPVDGLLYFSGEATNLGAGATCHAALESGIRCANQIAAHLKQSKVTK